MNPLLALAVVGAIFAFARRRRKAEEEPPETEAAPKEEPELEEEPETEEAPEEESEEEPELEEEPETEEAPEEEWQVVVPGSPPRAPGPFTSRLLPPSPGTTAVPPGVYSISIPGSAYLNLPHPADNFHVIETPSASKLNLYPANQSPRAEQWNPHAFWNLEVQSSTPGVLDVVFRQGTQDVARYVFEIR